MNRKCKQNCKFQMLETFPDRSNTKYVCDLYDEVLEHGNNIFYRCESCKKDLSELEIVEDVKNV